MVEQEKHLWGWDCVNQYIITLLILTISFLILGKHREKWFKMLPGF